MMSKLCRTRRNNRVGPDYETQEVEMASATRQPTSPAPKQVTIAQVEQTGNETATQMHAAAVNGDRSVLAKLLVSSSRDVDAGDQFGRTPLMFCILGDRLDCAELLIKAGCHMDQKDKGGRTALHWAAHKGNFRCLKLLITKGANYKEKDNEGQTALHLCTRHKSPKCLALLLKQILPGEIDDQDKSKRTALHWSASYGNLEHIKMLIKQDSNIGIPDMEGKTPLHWAASSKDPNAVNCVALLLETAPSVINWQDYEGRTALHLAVADGNEAVVTGLTSLAKCNVSALDNMFRTPLHWAAVLGHSKIVNILLEKDADWLSSDSNGATPLHYAAQNNYAETVNAFLSFPTKKITDEPDIEGRTAFMWAAGKGADDVIKTWVKHGTDLHTVDKNGGQALHAAALSGHASSVKLLLDNGAQINSHDLLKHTPLFRACEMGHTDVVQTLIDFGAKVEVSDDDGRSPLHWAALGGHAYICQTLIKYGIDPNVRDFSGRTPLQCAAYGGFVNCMSVLIEHKADPNAQDKEGMTALHWSCSKGHLDAVKLLIEYKAFPNHMEFTEDRYTPLDYALMGEHHDVAQFLIEQGALSINGIQDIAAGKIQSKFRGFRVRKTFLERKKLLMKHEQLRKDAAKKRAEEEYKKKEDVRNKTEIDKRRKADLANMEQLNAVQPPLISKKHKKSRRKSINMESNTATSTSKPDPIPEEPKPRKKKKEVVMTEEEKRLKKCKENQEIATRERQRQDDFRRKQNAAKIIQHAWGMYKFKNKGVLANARDAIKLKRLDAGEEAWKQQIAALTIQLAWRKFYRRQIMKTLTPQRSRVIHMWDPEIIAAKQKALVEQIYSEQLIAPEWYPSLKKSVRPSWFKYVPSAAALSFNFAIDQYHGPSERRGATFYDKNMEYTGDDLRQIKLSDSPEPKNYSYNMYEY